MTNAIFTPANINQYNDAINNRLAFQLKESGLEANKNDSKCLANFLNDWRVLDWLNANQLTPAEFFGDVINGNRAQKGDAIGGIKTFRSIADYLNIILRADTRVTNAPVIALASFILDLEVSNNPFVNKIKKHGILRQDLACHIAKNLNMSMPSVLNVTIAHLMPLLVRIGRFEIKKESNKIRYFFIK